MLLNSTDATHHARFSYCLGGEKREEQLVGVKDKTSDATYRAVKDVVAALVWEKLLVDVVNWIPQALHTNAWPCKWWKGKHESKCATHARFGEDICVLRPSLNVTIVCIENLLELY
jgi:hypothetical protein